MKVKIASWWRAVCVLILGILLVAYPDKTTELLVVMVGCLFLIPGIVSLVIYFSRFRKSAMTFPLLGVGSVLLGLILILMPASFVTVLMYVLGGVLMLVGAGQVGTVLRMRQYVTVPVMYYVIPVLVVLLGVLVIFNPIEVAGMPFLILGISCIICGLSDLWNLYRFRHMCSGKEGIARFNQVEEIEK